MRESPNGHTYVLADGQKVTFPYRIYCKELSDSAFTLLRPVQQLICHAIFTRSLKKQRESKPMEQ